LARWLWHAFSPVAITRSEATGVVQQNASDDAYADVASVRAVHHSMRTTVTLDDDLLARAHELSGVSERSQLLRQALVALVERESARRLAALGGSEPQLQAIPRRRLGAP
jgi:Arc/MetJ family transcription regulator